MTFGSLQRAEERLLARAGELRASLPPSATARVAAFSSLGEYGRIWVATGVAGALLDRERSSQWRAALVRLLLVYAGCVALKQIARRPRPAPGDGGRAVKTPTELSFPSSHATTAAAAAAAYGPLLRGWLGPRAARALVPVAAAMSLSRVYLGVHYPSDVAAGALLGALLGRPR